ncbi:MAG: hypothetical protein WCL20_07820 [Actinomycetes bacterium]
MRGIVVAAAVAIAILASGCGSDNLDSGELRSKVNAACSKAHQSLERIKDPKTADNVAAFLKAATAATAVFVTDLKALQPPADLQQAYGLAVSVVSEELAAMKSATKRIADGADPVVELRSVAQSTESLAGRERIAWQSVGADGCSNR